MKQIVELQEASLFDASPVQDLAQELAHVVEQVHGLDPRPGLPAPVIGNRKREVVVPWAMPGIVSGYIVVFMLTLGSYLTPILMGGKDSAWFTQQIFTQFITRFNWEQGAALGVLLLVLSSLMQHENKMSVMHFLVQKSDLTCEDPIQSKDPVDICCGFRRTTNSRPIFSQHNFNSDKHKYERFLQPGRFTCASAYYPISYGASPTLLMRTLATGRKQLVGSG